MNTDVLIVGGGPVAITSAKFLVERGVSVTILVPEDSIKFKKGKLSSFKLSLDSETGVLRGNQVKWGNQHDVDIEVDWNVSKFQNLPGFPFLPSALKAYEAQLAENDFPKVLPTFQPSPNLASFASKTILKVNSAYTFTNLDSRIRVVRCDPSTLDFNLDGRSIGSVTFSKTTIIFRYLVLAAGGLSNVYLVSLVLRKIGVTPKLLGKGYSNHPKRQIGLIRFHRFVKFRRKINKQLVVFGSFSLKQEAIERDPRVSFRLWPINDSSNIFKRYLNEIMMRLGVARTFAVVCYYEIPQVADSSIRVTATQSTDLTVDINIANFTSDYYGNVKSQEQSILEELSKVGKIHCSTDTEFAQIDLLMDSNHHMGGTRMGKRPADSVVDENCRLHQTDNVYVFGTSVLPVSSSEHPTYLAILIALKGAQDLLSRAMK